MVNLRHFKLLKQELFLNRIKIHISGFFFKKISWLNNGWLLGKSLIYFYLDLAGTRCHSVMLENVTVEIMLILHELLSCFEITVISFIDNISWFDIFICNSSFSKKKKKETHTYTTHYKKSNTCSRNIANKIRKKIF